MFLFSIQNDVMCKKQEVDDRVGDMIGGQYEEMQHNESQDEDGMYDSQWQDEEAKYNESQDEETQADIMMTVARQGELRTVYLASHL